jgi:transcription elongation factor Elf1
MGRRSSRPMEAAWTREACPRCGMMNVVIVLLGVSRTEDASGTVDCSLCGAFIRMVDNAPGQQHPATVNVAPDPIRAGEGGSPTASPDSVQRE